MDFSKCVKHWDSRRIRRKGEPFSRRFINVPSESSVLISCCAFLVVVSTIGLSIGR